MIDAKVQNDDVQAKVDFSARRAGKLQASAHTVVSKREGQWGVAGNAPLEWKLAGELNTLAWLSLIVETPLNAEGHIVVDAERTGTVRATGLARDGGQVIASRCVPSTRAPQLTNGRVRIGLRQQAHRARMNSCSRGAAANWRRAAIVNLEEVGPVGLGRRRLRSSRHPDRSALPRGGLGRRARQHRQRAIDDHRALPCRRGQAHLARHHRAHPGQRCRARERR